MKCPNCYRYFKTNEKLTEHKLNNHFGAWLDEILRPYE